MREQYEAAWKLARLQRRIVNAEHDINYPPGCTCDDAWSCTCGWGDMEEALEDLIDQEVQLKDSTTPELLQHCQEVLRDMRIKRFWNPKYGFYWKAQTSKVFEEFYLSGLLYWDYDHHSYRLADKNEYDTLFPSRREQAIRKMRLQFTKAPRLSAGLTGREPRLSKTN